MTTNLTLTQLLVFVVMLFLLGFFALHVTKLLRRKSR
jgi:hypothetical protein